ncbi:hypothetical protein ACQR1Y_32765, partial [Bradyrhizobium sp. HKCCYLRH3099]|uniref:hypothetical protein n=1 Tax=unclassified Bradyrhizobium TaxID=2631580 RepID=UPI003EB93870
FRFICPSFVRPDSKSFWRKFLGADQTRPGLLGGPPFAAPKKGASSLMKEGELRQIQDEGWVRADATYQQVDKLPPEAAQNSNMLIDGDQPLVVEDLSNLSSDGRVSLISIKTNVCRGRWVLIYRRASLRWWFIATLVVCAVSRNSRFYRRLLAAGQSNDQASVGCCLVVVSK